MNLLLRQGTDRSALRRVYAACRSAWIRSSRVVTWFQLANLWVTTVAGVARPRRLVAGGRVFVGSNDGRVYGLDLASGKKVWECEAACP